MKIGFLLLFVALLALHAQTSAKADAEAQAAQKALTEGASAGIPIPASVNVADSVNIEAVMLPEPIARRVFGGEVARNYAVIEVNISNRSNDASFIVHSLFIDLKDWGLAGPMGVTGVRGLTGAQKRPYQSRGSPLEVASVEYRIVRGEMLDRQPWTGRNLGLRTITVLGAIGTAFAFPFTTDVVKGIGAWNGALVPGFAALFPDGMQGQLDRVSDYGFRNNKVIPQQAADILIAFFPIKRFLTPSLEKIFRSSPALFFNPLLMIIDPQTRPILEPVLSQVFGSDEAIDKALQDLLGAYAMLDRVKLANDQERLDRADERVRRANAALIRDEALIEQDKDNPNADPAVAAKHKETYKADQEDLKERQNARDAAKAVVDTDLKPLTDNQLYRLLGSLSLNNVHVVVSGSMTVDVDNIPPIIASIDCKGADQPEFWAEPGDHTCVIHGSFLASGTPVIAEAAALGLTVGAVPEGSGDGVLNVKLTLTKPVPPKTVLTFQVTKKNTQGATMESTKFPYPVPDYTLPPPTISEVSTSGSTVTVKGTNFFTPVAVTAHAVTPSGIADQKIENPARTLTQIQFDDKGFAPACWQVQVRVGSAEAPPSSDKPPKDQFAVAPVPTIASAVLTDSKLTVTGTQFVNLEECGAKLSFEVLSDASGANPQGINMPELSADGRQATLTMPMLAAGAKWKEVHVLVNSKPAATAPITTK